MRAAFIKPVHHRRVAQSQRRHVIIQIRRMIQIHTQKSAGRSRPKHIRLIHIRHHIHLHRHIIRIRRANAVFALAQIKYAHARNRTATILRYRMQLPKTVVTIHVHGNHRVQRRTQHHISIIAKHRVLLQHHLLAIARVKLQPLSVFRAIFTAAVFHTTTRRHRISHREITQHLRRVRRHQIHAKITGNTARNIAEYVAARTRRYPK